MCRLACHAPAIVGKSVVSDLADLAWVGYWYKNRACGKPPKMKLRKCCSNMRMAWTTTQSCRANLFSKLVEMVNWLLTASFAPVKTERWFARQAISVMIISQSCWRAHPTFFIGFSYLKFCLQNTHALLKATAAGINSTEDDLHVVR